MNRSFRTAVRGYNKADVDSYIKTLQQNITDAEKRCNNLTLALKEKDQELLAKNKNEKTFKDAIAMAQDSISSSKKQAKLIIDEAKIEADRILFKANKEKEIARESTEEIRDEYKRTKVKYAGFLTAQLKMLEVDEA